MFLLCNNRASRSHIKSETWSLLDEQSYMGLLYLKRGGEIDLAKDVEGAVVEVN